MNILDLKKFSEVFSVKLFTSKMEENYEKKDAIIDREIDRLKDKIDEKLLILVFPKIMISCKNLWAYLA